MKNFYGLEIQKSFPDKEKNDNIHALTPSLKVIKIIFEGFHKFRALGHTSHPEAIVKIYCYGFTYFFLICFRHIVLY